MNRACPHQHHPPPTEAAEACKIDRTNIIRNAVLRWTTGNDGRYSLDNVVADIIAATDKHAEIRFAAERAKLEAEMIKDKKAFSLLEAERDGLLSENDFLRGELAKWKLIEGNLHESCKRLESDLAAARARVEELEDILHSIAEETDFRNIRGTIQRALKL